MDLQALNGLEVISHWTVAAYWLASAVFSDQSRVVLIRTARLFSQIQCNKKWVLLSLAPLSTDLDTRTVPLAWHCFHEAIIEACIPVRI
jgi:hypothetical protein